MRKALLLKSLGSDIDVVKLSVKDAIIVRCRWESWRRSPNADRCAIGQGIVGSIAASNVGVIGVLGIIGNGVKVIKNTVEGIADDFIVVDNIVQCRTASGNWQAAGWGIADDGIERAATSVTAACRIGH